jgi:hypothetical protein
MTTCPHGSCSDVNLELLISGRYVRSIKAALKDEAQDSKRCE